MKNKAKFYLTVMAACWNETENIDVKESYTYSQGDDTRYILCQTLKSVYEYVASLEEDERELRITSDMLFEICTAEEDYDEDDDEHVHPDEADSEQWLLDWNESTKTIEARFWSYGYCDDHHWFDGRLEYDGDVFRFGKHREPVDNSILRKIE